MNYIGWLENTAEGSIEHTRTTKLANEDCCFEKKKKTNQVPKQETLAQVESNANRKKDGDRRHRTEEDHLAAAPCSPCDK